MARKNAPTTSDAPSPVETVPAEPVMALPEVLRNRPEDVFIPVAPPVTVGVQNITLTPAEIAAIVAAREKLATLPVDAPANSEPKLAITDLAAALIQAIRATQPPIKKTPFTKIDGNPFRAKPGQVKPKLKRSIFLHGGEINPDQHFVEELELLNQLRPGTFFNGAVRVSKRKDRGYSISWPVRTIQQRLIIENEARPFAHKDDPSGLCAIIRRCIEEHNDPKRFKGPEDDDD